MNTDPTQPEPASVGLALTIFLTGVIAVALVGFVVGIGNVAPGSTLGTGAPSDAGYPSHAAPHGESGALASVAYSELRSNSIGPNRAFQTTPVAFAQPTIEIVPPIVITAEDKRRALAERAERRAYNGAPPTIPHTVDSSSSAACLACHQDGATIGDIIARPIPHAAYTNCQQCHSAELDVFGESDPFVRSTFEGLPAPFEGARAWPGAPPVIPHSTAMRENCVACHGPMGRRGLRTSHPWRVSCTQCHATSAALDHVAGLEASAAGSER